MCRRLVRHTATRQALGETCSLQARGWPHEHPHLPRILGEDGTGLLGFSEQDVLLAQKAPL